MSHIERISLAFNKIEEKLRRTNDAMIELREVATRLKRR